MAVETPLKLTPAKLALYLRGIADKLDHAEQFELLYDDTWYREFTSGSALKIDSEATESGFTMASASDCGDYFRDAFEPELNEMLDTDLWKMTQLLRYYDLILGTQASDNGN